ncbi:hypothetical protein PHLCEN_2v11920 [Hermanssonia centrifuga]|uniref:Uncharacterized protein n=1 Tax=Hermanssonia centrifuga TaxID=98765 RepID=A0A2R6NIQ5_9APHY|nr:hypothetical protein PHLCEN_2v11920 [Hermanssonia centrifuga]
MLLEEPSSEPLPRIVLQTQLGLTRRRGGGQGLYALTIKEPKYKEERQNNENV